MERKKIIVVDDERLIGVLMKEIIEEDQGLALTHIVTLGQEFLTLIQQEHFDAALVDISMGGFREGGLELLQTIKNNGFGHLPVVIVSAYDETHYALKCLQAGAQGYLNKRYICSDVVGCLKKVIDGALYVSGERGADILKQHKQLNTPARST